MSDQDKDLFDEAVDPTIVSDADNANNQNTTQDPFADQLGTILREDGTQKFNDVASALDSIQHSDKHISTIQEENAGLKDALAREKAAKEVLQNSANNKDTAQETLTAEQIGDIFDQRTVAREAANIQEANVNLVRDEFFTKYGDKAKEEMTLLADKSRMTKVQLRELSASSPQAVLQLAGIEAKQPIVQKTPYSPGLDQPSPQPKLAEPKSVMGGSDTKEIVSAWRAAGERIKQL